MKDTTTALEYLVYVGQLGLDLLMPVVLCVLLCWWLVSAFGVGAWVYVPGFLLGLGGGAMNFWKFWKRIEKRLNREHPPERPRTSFSRHL